MEIATVRKRYARTLQQRRRMELRAPRVRARILGLVGKPLVRRLPPERQYITAWRFRTCERKHVGEDCEERPGLCGTYRVSNMLYLACSSC